MKAEQGPVLEACEDHRVDERQWWIHLAPWVIQDGNYPDFEIGQRAEFAVEFDPRSLERAVQQAPAATPHGEARYSITAQVVGIDARRDDPSWIIDFGLRSYANGRPPQGVSVGDWVGGDTLLMVDHYWYFEVLSKEEAMPELIYTWSVEEIVREIAPTRSARAPGWGDVWEPDLGRRNLESVSRTDAWGDDRFGAGNVPPRHLAYRLRCGLQAAPPKRTSGTAT